MSTPSETSEERLHLIYENANSLRTHQDNLRWTISAGYFAFLGAALAFFEPNKIPAEIAVHLPKLLFVFSLFFLIILAVESWWYNVFSSYVGDCEAKFSRQHTHEPLFEFRKRIAATTTPFHHSFIFVLAFVALTNILFLHLCLKQFGITGVADKVILSVWLILLCCGCRYWNRLTYGLVLSNLERLLTRK